jgi:hypothetical protein
VPGYEILSELGRGGMGVVYKAKQRGLDRIVALKMILVGGHAGEPDLARFRTEGEAIARLQHSNIIQVFEVGESQGLPFFSLEFCAGGSLEKQLNGTPLPAREAAALVKTLAHAMQHAHQAGVLHRDLKPANVLLSFSREPLASAESALAGGSRLNECGPKITDFGLAKKLDDAGQTQSGAIMGTPSYMAPEQAGGKNKEIGPAADIYALGAILYECLTGRPPFKAATALDTILQVVADEPVPPSQLQSRTPRDLETICLKCLQKEPARRYESAAALADDLRRFAEGRPIVARPVGRLERAAKWVRRNPLLAGVSAALVLVLVIGAAVSIGFGIDAREQAKRAQSNEADAVAKGKELATANETLTRSRDEMEQVLARSLLRPLALQFQPFVPVPPLTEPEIDSLGELASSKEDSLRTRFVREALRGPTTTRQLKDRAAVALHAAVGLDARRRTQVEQVLVERWRAPGTIAEEQEDIALVLAHLGIRDSSLAAQVGTTLSEAMSKRPFPWPAQAAQGLSLVAVRMEPKEAAAILIQAMMKTTDRTQQHVLAQALAVTARVEGKEVAPILSQAMTQTTEPYLLLVLAQGLSAAAERMESKEAAAVCRQGIPVLKGAAHKTRDLSVLQMLAQGLAALTVRMEPKEGAAILTQTMTEIGLPAPFAELAQGLVALSARMEPKDAAAALTHALNRATEPRAFRMISQGLVAVAGRMEAPEAAAVCRQTVATLIQYLGFTSDGVLQMSLLQCVSLVGARLEPKGVAAALTTAMSRQQNAYPLRLLAEGLAAALARMDPQEASTVGDQAAATLIEVMKKTDQANRYQLVQGLSLVAARMEAGKAAVVCGQAAAILTGTLSKPTDAPTDAATAVLLASVAERMEAKEAVAALSGALSKTTQRFAQQVLAQSLSAAVARLEPRETGAVCRQVAGTLHQALKNPANAQGVRELAEALSAVAGRLEAQEAAAVCGEAATNLAGGMKSPGIPYYQLSALGESLAVLAGRIEAPKAALVCAEAAASLSAALDKTNDAGNLNELAQALLAVSARLESREADRLCRLAAVKLTAALLMAPGVNTNAATYAAAARGLLVAAARMEAKEAAATLTQALSKAPDAKASELLAQGLANVAARLEATAAGATLTGAMSTMAEATTLSQLLQGVLAVAARMEPKEAATVLGQAATILTGAMNKPMNYNTSRTLSDGLALLAARMELDAAAAACRRAALILIQTMSTTTTPWVEEPLFVVLSREPRTASRERVLSLATMLAGLSPPGTPFLALVRAQTALEPVPPPLPAQTLVDVLAQPLCVGEARRVVLEQLARHYHRPFADQWEFVEYVQQHGVAVNLSSLAQRVEQPQ